MIHDYLFTHQNPTQVAALNSSISSCSSSSSYRRISPTSAKRIILSRISLLSEVSKREEICPKMSVLNPNSEEEAQECPLCMELLELDDINFYPCSCGYQVRHNPDVISTIDCEVLSDFSIPLRSLKMKLCNRDQSMAMVQLEKSSVPPFSINKSMT